MVMTKKNNSRFTTIKSKRVNTKKKNNKINTFKTRKNKYKSFPKLLGKRTIKKQSGSGFFFTSKEEKELNKTLEQYLLDIKKYYTDKTKKIIDTKNGLDKYKHKIHRTSIKLINKKINKYLYKFIKSILKKLKQKYLSENFKIKSNNSTKEKSFYNVLNDKNYNVINYFLKDIDNIKKEFTEQDYTKDKIIVTNEEIETDLKSKNDGLYYYEIKHSIGYNKGKKTINDLPNKLYLVIKNKNNISILPYHLYIINFYINKILIQLSMDKELVKIYYLKIKSNTKELKYDTYRNEFVNFIIDYIKFKYPFDI